MKKNTRLLMLLAFPILFSASTTAQTPSPQPTPLTRPRIVTVIPPPSSSTPTNAPAPATPKIVAPRTPTPQPTPLIPTSTPATTTQATTHAASPQPTATLPATNETTFDAAPLAHPLALSKIRARIAEAQRLLKARPMLTAMTKPATDFVTLAALDPQTSQVHLLNLSKDVFLTKGAELTLTSSLGTPLQMRVVRANGVNTAVTIFDNAGRSFVPLVVEYPIEHNGFYRETAYYTSVHPALVSPELVKAGQSYVHNMVDLAARRLHDKGVMISPQIVDVAERLCIVEHIDHDRFRRENRPALYEEIFSLYALNELDTYRYSVSTAGAGGMVQMIPWTYQLMRQRHPGVGLNPDFVLGMRNHGNALEAMLLYMQDTWNDLIINPDISYALSAKLATPDEILSAGYNSNPARLPLYINRGNTSWRTLIPRETQMYLQIYRSLDALVPIKSRS
jgi:hypothetical protein